MKVRDVMKYDDTLRQLMDNFTMDVKVKFRFLNMRKQFEPIIENFQKMREEILEKHAEKREDGSMGIFAPEEDKFDSKEEYNKAVEKFQSTVADFDKEVDKILDDDANIEIVPFKAADILNAGVPSDALLVIRDIIEE